MKVSDAILAGVGASLPSRDAPAAAPEKFSCPTPNGSFCLGPSLTMPILIKCENSVPSPVNCIQQAASRPPFDNSYASCYQSTPQAGDAACSKSCTVYPTNGEPFPVPGECKARPPQESATPYPPAQHFARIGGLNLNTSSHSNTTSATAAGSFVMPPLPIPTTSCSSSYPIPPASAVPAPAPVASPPPPPIYYNGNHEVPTPQSSLPPSPPKVQPSVPFASYSGPWQHASYPAPSFPHPQPVPAPAPTQPSKRPTDLSGLPIASLPSYITTVSLTNGTTTQMHTVFSNCGSGTMIIGPGTESSYSVVPVTGTSAPLWPVASGSGTVTLTPSTAAGVVTVPCSEATGGPASDGQLFSSNGVIISSRPTTTTTVTQSEGFTQATGTHSPDEEQNSGAPSTVQRSLFWMAATIVLAAFWPC